jgi:hypothetical protein
VQSFVSVTLSLQVRGQLNLAAIFLEIGDF